MKKLGLKRGTVELISEQDFWKEEFEKEKAVLLKIFGNKVLGLEHIGSTSVPGLLAKPIIDILLGLESIDIIENFQKDLELNGYTYRPNGSAEGEKLFVKGPEENRTHYMHITTFESKQYKNDIFFREYLRNHEDEKREYENLKIKLKETYSENREEYTKNKKSFIERILRKNMKRKIFFVHGLGVKKDARGMFTDIQKNFSQDESLKDTEYVFTDLNILEKDEEGKEKLILNPLSVQAEILNNAYKQFSKTGVGEVESQEEVILICHSQGCVVAAIADLPSISKTIFIAPPTKNDIERSVDRFKVRPGTIINIDADSFVTRSDGSQTVIPKEYWEDRKELDYMETYKNYAEKNNLEIIFGLQDEIVSMENAREMQSFGKIHSIPGDHDFKGGYREGLISKLKEILIN